jgi:hypothetical protein
MNEPLVELLSEGYNGIVGESFQVRGKRIRSRAILAGTGAYDVPKLI